MVDGYTHDKRELYEIPEVRRWFKKVDKSKLAWFYFCNTAPPAFGLTLYFMCVSNAKVIDDRERLTGLQVLDAMKQKASHPKIRVTFNPNLYTAALDENWLRLNQKTEALGLSEEMNKQISREVTEHLFPDKKKEISEIYDN